MELKRELSILYSAILYDSHVTQAFSKLEQGPDEFLDMYLCHTSDFLSELYHTSNMSKILAGGLKHYAVVFGLDCRRLKDSVVGHQSMQWKMIEDCFRDICNFGAGYEKAVLCKAVLTSYYSLFCLDCLGDQHHIYSILCALQYITAHLWVP